MPSEHKTSQGVDSSPRTVSRSIRLAAMIGVCVCLAVMLFAVLAVGGCLWSRDPLAGVTPDQQVRIKTPDGRQRTARMIVPEGNPPPDGHALVVMLHGAGGSTRNIVEATRWDQLAKREGLVVVFPNGTPSDEAKPERFFGNPQTWNSGAGTSLAAGELSAEAKGIDDVGFIAERMSLVHSATTHGCASRDGDPTMPAPG